MKNPNYYLDDQDPLREQMFRERQQRIVQRNDPWREMAIERQFLPLILPPRGLEPATLTYFQQEADLPIKRNVLSSHHQNINNTVEYLVLCLDKRVFARALAEIIWGEETPFELAKNLTLDDPTELISVAVGFGVP